MVLDFKRFLTNTETKPITTNFLEQYSILFSNLESVFRARKQDTCNYSTASYHVSMMKNFVIESGGSIFIEFLSEYEKNCSIGDYVSANRLEKRILEDLNVF